MEKWTTWVEPCDPGCWVWSGSAPPVDAAPGEPARVAGGVRPQGGTQDMHPLPGTLGNIRRVPSTRLTPASATIHTSSLAVTRPTTSVFFTAVAYLGVFNALICNIFAHHGEVAISSQSTEIMLYLPVVK